MQGPVPPCQEKSPSPHAAHRTAGATAWKIGCVWEQRKTISNILFIIQQVEPYVLTFGRNGERLRTKAAER